MQTVPSADCGTQPHRLIELTGGHSLLTREVILYSHGRSFFTSGYVDTRVRPWNTQATKSRQAGEYYDRQWSAALAAEADWIGITSFNEWHEGTQIEPAVEAQADGAFDYQTYHSGPNSYLKSTRSWVNQFDATAVAA